MKIWFKFFLYFLLLLRQFLALISYLGPRFLSKKLRKRVAFEKRNRNCDSFRKNGLIANVAFEVSSEGELEQVRPIIVHYLERGQRVEVVFASESVEAKCLSLVERYPEQVRIYRLPLLSFTKTVGAWLTSTHLILCRYDFYPQLLIYGAAKGHKLSLVSATLKNKKLSRTCTRLFLKNLYRSFSKIVVASQNDQQSFGELIGGQAPVFDFRIIQIMRRVKHFGDKWSKMALGEVFDNLISPYKKESRIILGSCWSHEMGLFSNQQFQRDILSGEILAVLAPHQLNAKALASLKSSFEEVTEKKIPYYHITPEMDATQITGVISQFSNAPGIVVISVPAILCELYSFFGFAYVGGGFGRSIHSVLEPYLAGASVVCGPRTHRSTEFDLVSSTSPNLIKRIERLADFYVTVKQMQLLSGRSEARELLIEKAQQDFEDIVCSME